MKSAIAPAVLLAAAAACSSNTSPTPNICCKIGAQVTLVTTCSNGIELPAENCAAADGGTPLSDGGTTADGGSCDNGACQKNADCPVTGQICRMCGCQLATVAAVFKDPGADLMGGVTAGYADIKEVDMVPNSNGGGTSIFQIVLADTVPTMPAGTFRACLAEGATGSESTLCVQIETNGSASLHYKTPGGDQTLEISGVTMATGGFKISVQPNLGLNKAADTPFYWFTEVGGVVADRLPDTGTFTMSAVYGR